METTSTLNFQIVFLEQRSVAMLVIHCLIFLVISILFWTKILVFTKFIIIWHEPNGQVNDQNNSNYYTTFMTVSLA